jgi:hypothetical protein
MPRKEERAMGMEGAVLLLVFGHVVFIHLRCQVELDPSHVSNLILDDDRHVLGQRNLGSGAQRKIGGVRMHVCERA